MWVLLILSFHDRQQARPILQNAGDSKKLPKIDGIPLRVLWYSEPSFSAGIQVVMMDGVPVRVYSREKTIADCFKYRNKTGLDIAIEALRTYRARSRKPNAQALAKFAQIDRVQKVMRPYLEAIL